MKWVFLAGLALIGFVIFCDGCKENSMSIANKLANENHDEIARMTTRGTSKHGLKKGVAREKRIRNRAAKREEAEIEFKTCSCIEVEMCPHGGF